MRSLQKIISEGNLTEYGLQSELDWESPFFISETGIALVGKHPRELGSLVRAAHKYSKLGPQERFSSKFLTKYEDIDGGQEGRIYRVKLGDDAHALKVYREEHRRGLDYFEAVIEARKEGVIDTVIPYMATQDFFLMSSIPNIPHYNDFVQTYPHLKPEISEAIRKLPTKVSIESRDGGELDPDAMKHVYISAFNATKEKLTERYRFFIIDLKQSMMDW